MRGIKGASFELVEWSSGEWSIICNSSIYDVSVVEEASDSGQYFALPDGDTTLVTSKCGTKLLVKAIDIASNSGGGKPSSRVIYTSGFSQPTHAAGRPRSGNSSKVTPEFLEESDIEE